MVNWIHLLVQSVLLEFFSRNWSKNSLRVKTLPMKIKLHTFKTVRDYYNHVM